jgi:hypothetical protein
VRSDLLKPIEGMAAIWAVGVISPANVFGTHWPFRADSAGISGRYVPAMWLRWLTYRRAVSNGLSNNSGPLCAFGASTA